MFTQKNKSNLLPRFIEYNRDHALFLKHERILLGVSGGLDSMVMLHLFRQIQYEYDLRLTLIHLNHGLRGSYADADEQFVHEYARKLGFPFFSSLANVRQSAITNRLSVEEEGRIQRFEFFLRILNQICFDKLSLAHHADDRAETVLMHIIRGSGLQGLTGIAPKRDRVIHPMLFASRSEIQCWAGENDVPFHEDRSNQERMYFRNRIRLDVMQDLKQKTPRIAHIICRTADAAAEAEEWIQEGVRQAVSENVILQNNDETILDIHQFLQYFTAVQKAIIIRAIRLSRPGSHFVTNQEIEGLYKLIHHAKSGAVYSFSDSLFAVVSGHFVLLTKKKVPEYPDREIALNQWVKLPEWNGKIRMTSGIITKDRPRLFHSQNVEYLDGSELESPFFVRTWHRGDRFQPLGMKGYKKIQDFFIDIKIPNYSRHHIPILWDKNGIVWVIGYRISDRFRLKPETKTVVKSEWKTNKNRKPV